MGVEVIRQEETPEEQWWDAVKDDMKSSGPSSAG